jgi:hypothetical protein
VGLEVSGCSNKNIIHIDNDVSGSNFFPEDRVHYCLESGRGIGEAEKHDQRFEKSSVGFECGFSFISFFHSDIVVSPPDVKLGKPLFSNELTDKFLNKRKGIVIAYGVVIEYAVVLNWSCLGTFLSNKEKRRGVR